MEELSVSGRCKALDTTKIFSFAHGGMGKAPLMSLLKGSVPAGDKAHGGNLQSSLGIQSTAS